MDAGCGRLILDLRNNIGGEDDIAASILGSFYPEKAFYEYQNVYDPDTGPCSIQTADTASNSPALWIEPAEYVYTEHIIALINQKCISSGEGIGVPYLVPHAPFNLYDFVRSLSFNISFSPYRRKYLRDNDKTRTKV